MSTGVLSLMRHAQERPYDLALIAPGETWRWGALGERVRATVARLRAQGVERGSRVAFVAENTIESLVCTYAALESHACVVPLHTRWTEQERAQRCRVASVDLTIEPATVAAPRDELSPVSATPASAVSTENSDELTLPAAVVFTSGTTGEPKPIVLSRGAFVASALASASNLGWRRDDRWLLAMPLAHVGGLSIVTRTLMAGVPMTIHPRFDPFGFLDAVERGQVTLASIVPTMLKSLLEADRRRTLGRARAILVGGAGTSNELRQAAAAHGIPALASYGLTETCSQVATQRFGIDTITRPGVGPPLPGFQVRVESGTLRVWRATLGHRDWLDTRDAGEVDEQGHIHVRGRVDDVVVTGGENVHPAEVEAALERCPGVERAIVFGVPDPRWGESVAALLIGQSLRTSEALRAVRSALEVTLARYKHPRFVGILHELPEAFSGPKVDRRAARNAFGAELKPWR